MLHFQYSTLINASVEAVWRFHEREDILQILTPPWQPVQVIRREGGLDVGAITEFRLFLGPIPITWLALHVECQEYKIFADQQVKGPMKSWLHCHIFTQENGQTRLTDSIEYAIPGGQIAELLLGWWVEARLRDMFRYRHQVTVERLEDS